MHDESAPLNKVAREAFGDTWVFNGVEETWEDITPTNDEQHPSPRYHHSAAALSSAVSSCYCRQSVMIYGGVEYDLIRRSLGARVRQAESPFIIIWMVSSSKTAWRTVAATVSFPFCHACRQN